MLIELVLGVGALALAAVAAGVRIVQPTQRGFLEHLGKPIKYVTPGFYFVIPLAQKLRLLDVQEFRVDVERQEIITKDRLNLSVDAQIYFKVRDKEEEVFKALYDVNKYAEQISNLTRTTMRNIIGTMSFEEANSKRDFINAGLMDALIKPSSSWGMGLTRSEVSSIAPPRDVQEAMNSIINAESKKRAAVNLSEAAISEANGRKESAIKEAEGNKQKEILTAEGDAEAILIRAEANAAGIKQVNDAVEGSFKERAQLKARLEATQRAFENNTKFFVPAGTDLTMLIGEAGGITPIVKKK